jgi:hypothetical protein
MLLQLDVLGQLWAYAETGELDEEGLVQSLRAITADDNDARKLAARRALIGCSAESGATGERAPGPHSAVSKDRAPVPHTDDSEVSARRKSRRSANENPNAIASRAKAMIHSSEPLP